MPPLSLDHPPGHATAWAGEGALRLPAAMPVTLVALHAAGPGRLEASLWHGGREVARAAQPGGAGWRHLCLAASHADELRWHAPALRLSLAAGQATPALRLWSAPVPEAIWIGARLTGPGALLALGKAPPRPHFHLASGEVARIILARPLPPGVEPRPETLRGHPPLATWQDQTMVLRAGAFWEGVL